MKKIIFILLVLMISLSIFSCTTEEELNDVYVTVYPMQFVTEEIFSGTDYTVGIVPGVTSHETSVDWSPKEIIAMTEATYLFYVGANYDQYIDMQISSIFSNKDVVLVKVENEPSYVQLIQGVFYDHGSNEVMDNHSLGLDPHFWVSPQNIIGLTKLIYDKLILKFDDPNNVMESNYYALLDKLQKLSDDYQDVISKATKKAMTSTNIYGYLREDYGYNYISISPGYHEEAEQFTGQAKEEIVNLAIENNIKYIIYEKYTSSPLSNAVFDELNSLNLEPVKLEFNILQALPDDERASGKNYITIMYDNLEVLKLALGYEIE